MNYLLMFLAGITASWDSNTEPDLAGYRIYYGTSSSSYSNIITIDKDSVNKQFDVKDNQHYFIAMTAFDESNNESPLSKQFAITVGTPTEPLPPQSTVSFVWPDDVVLTGKITKGDTCIVEDKLKFKWTQRPVLTNGDSMQVEKISHYAMWGQLDNDSWVKLNSAPIIGNSKFKIIMKPGLWKIGIQSFFNGNESELSREKLMLVKIPVVVEPAKYESRTYEVEIEVELK